MNARNVLAVRAMLSAKRQHQIFQFRAARQARDCAHILVSKYCDHLPLYRQQCIYKREGIYLPRSTMSDWVGHRAWLLRPLVDLIANQVLGFQDTHGRYAR